MSSNLKYTKNYTELGESYQLVLPLCLEGLISEDESVRLLSHELEELDYTLLYQAYSAKGRNPAVDPKTMFKILTYAYSQNIYSSRRIETACRRDIDFMWLPAGQKALIAVPLPVSEPASLLVPVKTCFIRWSDVWQGWADYQKKLCLLMAPSWKPVPINVLSSGRNP